MLTRLKLLIKFELPFLKKQYKIKAKTRRYYNSLHKDTKTAFTLAEVLITLLIIGVITSLTIPGLITNTQNQEFKVAWKKEFAELSHASNFVFRDNGETFLNLCGSVGDHDCMKNKFLPYFSNLKVCTTSNVNGNCWHSNGCSGVVLNNGHLLRFFWNGPDCNGYWGSVSVCGSIAVDVNGFKGPNQSGKDIFMIVFAKNKVIPVGSIGAYPMATDCTESGTGMGCSALYLLQ